jgi:ABC-type transporter Mla subunit MlaD
MKKQTIKRMVLTGATVMVLMGFAVPAIAAPYRGEGGTNTTVITQQGGGANGLQDFEASVSFPL